MSRDISPILPQACLVRFPGRRCSSTPDQSIPTWYTRKVTLSSLIDDLNTDLTAWEQILPDGITGSVGNAVFHETAQALFNPPGADPTNKTNLDSLAEVIARDFYRWRLIGFDLVYRGILNPLPTALYDDIEWRYRANGVTTRLLSSSLGGVNAGGGGGGSVEELNHSDGLHEKDCKDPDDLSTIVSKLPRAEMYGPFTGSTTGTMHLPVFLISIVDGRIEQKYSRTDVINCSCITCGNLCITMTGCAGAPIGAVSTLTQTPVASLTLVSGGSGYTAGAYSNGSFTGGGSPASGGTFNYSVTATVRTLTRTSGGSGYTVGSFSDGIFTGGGGGSGATFSYTVIGGVSGLTRTSGGSNYNDGNYTDGTFTGGGGTGATFSYTITGGVVQSALIVTNAGSGYTSVPTPVLGAGAIGLGSGFAANVATSGAVQSTLTLTNAGSGYTSAPTPVPGPAAGSGVGFTGTSTLNTGSVQPTLTITQGGSYITAPTPHVSAGAGSGFSATATLGTTTTIGSCTVISGQVASVARVSGGSGYTNGSYTNGTFTGGGGSGATFSYTISGGSNTGSITVTNPGSGYTSAPTPVISAGPGTGFAATSTINGKCCIPISAADTYKLVTTATGYNTDTRNVTVTCIPTNNVTISMAASSGYNCSSCCQGFPIPTTLTATTSYGSCTLTYNATDQRWYGGLTFTTGGHQTGICFSLRCITSPSIQMSLTATWFVSATTTDKWGICFYSTTTSPSAIACVAGTAGAAGYLDVRDDTQNSFVSPCASSQTPISTMCNPVDLIFDFGTTCVRSGITYPAPGTVEVTA